MLVTTLSEWLLEEWPFEGVLLRWPLYELGRLRVDVQARHLTTPLTMSFHVPTDPP